MPWNRRNSEPNLGDTYLPAGITLAGAITSTGESATVTCGLDMADSTGYTIAWTVRGVTQSGITHTGEVPNL